MKRERDTIRQTGPEWLELALEAVQVGVWDCEVVTGEVRYSENLEALYGLTPGSFEGTCEAFLQRVHPEDRERVLRIIEAAIEEGKECDLEFRFERPDRGVRWMSGKGRALVDESGRAVRLIGIGMDITVRKGAEAALLSERERVARVEGALQAVRTLQHEINNPLQALLLTLDLLEKDLGPLEGRNGARFQRLKEASERIFQVVQQIGKVSGVEPVASPAGDMLRLPESLS